MFEPGRPFCETVRTTRSGGLRSMLQLVWTAVVRRDRPEVHRQLSRRPSDDVVVEVQWDRRQSERRTASQPGQTARHERRQNERRDWLPDTWGFLGFLLIPRTERLASEGPSVERAGERHARADATVVTTPPERPGGSEGLILQRRRSHRGEAPGSRSEDPPVRASRPEPDRNRTQAELRPSPRSPELREGAGSRSPTRYEREG